MAAALRTAPAPPAPAASRGQCCFVFLAVTVVVHAPGIRTRRACLARHTPEQLPLAPRPSTARRPRRPPALRPYAPRNSMPGARPRSMGVKGLTEQEFQETERDVAELEAAGVYAARPKTFGECAPGPCGFVSCRHHLKLEVDPVTLSVKDNWPGVDVDEMPETCSLRVADAVDRRGGDPMPLEEVGRYLNVTMERARQLGEEAQEVMKRRMDRVRKAIR